MRLPVRIALLLCLTAAALPAEVILTLKSGERYELPRPATRRNGMVSFKTKDGRFLTVRQSEVAREETVVPPAPVKKIDQTDTKQLGAVAREEREERGIDADVAGRPEKEKPTKAGPPPAEKPKPASVPKKTSHSKNPHPKKKPAEAPPPPPPPPDGADPH